MNKWTCYLCLGQTEGERPAWCSACGGVGSFTRPVQRPVADALVAAAAGRPVSARAVAAAGWAVETCAVTGLAFGPGAVLLVHGPPGSGKSTLCAAILGQVTPALIVSLEERPGPALASRLVRAGLADRDDVLVDTSGAIGPMVEMARKGGGVLIDSVTVSSLLPPDLRRIADAGAGLVVAVSQETKAGVARGTLGWAHEADIVIAAAAGRWTLEKSRFQGGGASGGIPALTSAAPVDDAKVVQIRRKKKEA